MSGSYLTKSHHEHWIIDGVCIVCDEGVTEDSVQPSQIQPRASSIEKVEHREEKLIRLATGLRN